MGIFSKSNFLKELDSIDLYEHGKKRKLFKNVSLETSEKVARLIESGQLKYDDIFINDNPKNLNDVVVSFKDFFNTKDYHDKYDKVDNSETTGMIEFCDNHVKNNPLNSIINFEETKTEVETEEVKNEELEVSEPKVEEDLTKKVHIPFTMNNYVFEDDGTVRIMNSSKEDSMKELVPTIGLANIIINNNTIKELIPELKAEDIFIDHHMLLMKVKRDEEEIYRIDIINNNILVQAPIEFPYENFGSPEQYNFVSVPVDTDIGRKILTTKNYKLNSIDMTNIVANNCIFRENQNAA